MNVEWSAFRNLDYTSIKAYVPVSAGIYLFYVKLKDETWRCYYVGQADNLEQRLLDHISSNEQNECIKNHVSNHVNGYRCAKIGRQGDRDGVERFLYDHFKPECNKIVPSGSPMGVNLP